MSVSHRVTGTWAELTADGAVTIPSTPQAGDRMYLFARWKDFSVTAQVANWTELEEFADGSVTSGNGTGSVKVACWYRDWQSGDTDPTIDFSANPTNASAVITVMAKAATDTWLTPIAVTAAMTNWTSSPQTVSASSTAVVLGGGVVMGLIGIRDDTATMTRPTNGIDDAAGAITWNGNYVESPATHHSTTTGDDGATDLGYRLVTAGATATLRMTGTISAAETGAALWVVQAVEANLVIQESSHAHNADSLSLTQVHELAVGSTAHAQTAPNLELTQVHSLAIQEANHSHAAANLTLTEVYDLTIQNTSHAHSADSLTLAQTHTLTIANALHAHIAQSPNARTFLPTWLDPGGDAVQAVGYFNTLITGDVSFDTTQKVVGVGSWKCDSGDGTPGLAYVKVPGVLAPGGGDNSRRISFWWRYDSVPDDSVTVNQFAAGPQAYSGGGFTNPSNFDNDNGTYATATPARNAGQGTFFGFVNLPNAIPPSAVIDAVKIIYERKYDVNTSIGISRVKWRVNSVEGPNHDNTDQPLTDTVVEVSVTTDRGWEPQDFANGVFEVIAEARRGDTDTPHTQSWDYVKVEVVFHLPAGILAAVSVSDNIGFQIGVTQTGAGVALRFIPEGERGFDGITQLLVDTNYRITLAYVHHGIDDLDIKLYVGSVEELSIEGASTDGISFLPNLFHGWIASPGASHRCWFDQIYIDDGSDLADPGNKLMTAKLSASTNENEWDTTGGTGAVNERPLSITNYKKHVASSLARQSYTLQTAATGDVDISGETIVGYMGWLWCALQTDDFDSLLLILNGSDGSQRLDISTDPALPSLLTRGVTSPTYPSNAAGVGMSYQGFADAFLYECGVIVCYEGPDINPNRLLAYHLLAQDSVTPLTDDLRATPPDTYDLGWQVSESGAQVVIEVYAITAEGQEPQLRTTIYAGPGKGLVPIENPGIEVSFIIRVTEANVYMGLHRYLNLT